ncbi:MAG TPA: filamentous hemagglutinin N-terminal domain-containing protein, partial [Acidiphilium sp.]
MNSRPNETRNRHGRRHKAASRRLLLASTALTAALLAAPRGYAEPPMPAPNTTPQGGQVVGGSASITQGAGSTTITQSSQRAAIDWQSFNVGSNAHVTFVQPNAQAIALNRVISENPSIIAGRIDANGQIVLMNQSGVVFAHGSQVNAESLIVSTSGISAKNFMAGKLIFDQPPHPGARIVNDGRITMKQAGLAAFVAP